MAAAVPGGRVTFGNRKTTMWEKDLPEDEDEDEGRA